MKRIGSWLGLASLVLLGTLAEAQSMGAARGKVLDEKDQPVEGASIHLDYLGDLTRTYDMQTNKKGEYTQIGIYPGTYRFTFSKDGYQGSYLDYKVTIGEPTYLPDVKLKSRVAIQQAASAQVDTLREDFGSANELIRQKKFPEAVAMLQALAEKHPDVPQIQNNLGYCHREMKDWVAAEAEYKKALELDPDLSDARLGLARTYRESGQEDKAAALLGSEESQSDPKVQFDLGLNLLNEMKNDEAYAALKKSEELGNEDPELQYYLGTLALNLGRVDETVQRLERYLEMGPTNETNKQTAQGLVAALKPKN